MLLSKIKICSSTDVTVKNAFLLLQKTQLRCFVGKKQWKCSVRIRAVFGHRFEARTSTIWMSLLTPLWIFYAVIPVVSLPSAWPFNSYSLRFLTSVSQGVFLHEIMGFETSQVFRSEIIFFCPDDGTWDFIETLARTCRSTGLTFHGINILIFCVCVGGGSNIKFESCFGSQFYL